MKVVGVVTVETVVGVATLPVVSAHTMHAIVCCGTWTGTLSAAGSKVSTYLLGCISLILNTLCTVGPCASVFSTPPPEHSLPMQAIYVLLQKKFIFMPPKCEACGALLH